MKRCRILVFSLLFVLLGLSLMLGGPMEANAGGTLTETEWKGVACYIDRYIGSQHAAGPDTLVLGDGDNEYNFVHSTAQYMTQVDNDPYGIGGAPDGTVCGVGDNIANRPVLVDNLVTTLSTMIPGTSIRNLWNGGATSAVAALSPAALTALKAKVNAHREAGFSTDISVY